MESLLAGYGIGCDWHDFVLIPAVTCVLFPLFVVAIGFIFPPHVSLPVRIAMGTRITSRRNWRAGFCFERGGFLGFGNVCVFPMATTVAHGDGAGMNAGHRHDRNTHGTGDQSTVLVFFVVVADEMRTGFFKHL